MDKPIKVKKPFNPSVFLWIIVAVLVVIAGSTSFYVVDETEQAVVTRLGKYQSTEQSGLHFKLPFGLEKNYNVPVTVIRTEQFGFKTVKAGRNNEYRNNITSESSMLTGDLNIVEVEWVIQYKIEDPKAWLFGVYEKENTIRDISRSVINELVGDRAILKIMSTDRETIQIAARDMMNDYYSRLGLGIKVRDVQLQNIVPPEGVQAAFEDVNKATQDMNRLINEGKEAYNSEIPKVKGEADKLIQLAEGYASERVNKARGDVARFNAVYDEYKRSPKVTRERIYLETMEEVLSGKNRPELIDGELKNVLPIKDLNGGKQ